MDTPDRAPSAKAPQHLDTVIQHIRTSIPDVIAVYSFGSHARGLSRHDSDVDIAVLTPSPLSELRRYELAQDLAIQLHRDVDLIDLRTASAVMRMQVLSGGSCLTCSDESARQQFEMYAYADYARLNEERADLLKHIVHRGLVHGR